MIQAKALYHLTCGFQQLAEAASKAVLAFQEWSKLFEDRDSLHAVYEGEWPDRFTLLNRFIRTGLRPPFIINE